MRRNACLLLLLIGAACAKHDAAPAPPSPAPPAEPTRQQLAAIRAPKLDIAPPTARRDQAVNVTVTLENAPSKVPLTLAWFGADGWLVHDQQTEARGATASFTVPPDTFPQPGRYHADVRADVVHLAGGELTVTQ
jgi:hypothetical protein